MMVQTGPENKAMFTRHDEEGLSTTTTTTTANTSNSNSSSSAEPSASDSPAVQLPPLYEMFPEYTSSMWRTRASGAAVDPSDPSGLNQNQLPQTQNQNKPHEYTTMTYSLGKPNSEDPGVAITLGSGANYGPVAGSGPSSNFVKKRRGNLPKEVTNTLWMWLNEHVHHPYPTEQEKLALMDQTGLSMNQISNWFINVRRRNLKKNNGKLGPNIKDPSSSSNDSRPSASNSRGNSSGSVNSVKDGDIANEKDKDRESDSSSQIPTTKQNSNEPETDHDNDQALLDDPASV